MRLTGGAAFGRGTPSDRDRSISVLRRAVELGVNHIDTAAFYFSPLRSANELINRALAPYPDDLVIATKVGPGRDPSGEWLPWATPGQLRGQVEENLRQLGRDHLDVVNLRAYGHRFDRRALRRAGRAARRRADPPPGHLQRPARSTSPRPRPSRRWSACRTATASTPTAADADDFLRGCGEQGIAFVPFFAIAGDGSRSGRRAAPSTTRYSPSRAPTGRRPHRSGWPGRCSRGRTCWPSRAPATRTTSPRTWPPARCGSRREKWTVSSRSAIRGRKPRGRPHRAATAGRPSLPAAGATGPPAGHPGPASQPGALGMHLQPRRRGRLPRPRAAAGRRSLSYLRIDLVKG